MHRQAQITVILDIQPPVGDTVWLTYFLFPSVHLRCPWLITEPRLLLPAAFTPCYSGCISSGEGSTMELLLKPGKHPSLFCTSNYEC